MPYIAKASASTLYKYTMSDDFNASRLSPGTCGAVHVCAFATRKVPAKSHKIKVNLLIIFK
jgi:hypothetical protein